MRRDLVELSPGWLATGDDALARVSSMLDTLEAIADGKGLASLEPRDREVIGAFHREALTVKAQRRRALLELVDLLDDDDNLEGVELLTAAEVAPMLGIAVTTVTWRARTGKLPGWRKGRAWLFDRDEIERIALEERSG